MTSINIEGTIALVTGSNRGIGRAITEALLEQGAAKVYAGARKTESLQGLVDTYGERVVPISLDVTDAEQVKAAAAQVTDLRLLINNAGVALGGGLTDEGIVESARQEMEVNYFAPLRLLQQLAPVLTANGGGAVVNVASVAGLTNFAFFPTYSASKAAAHSLTQASRALLKGQNISTFGVYPGPVDTDMAEDLEMDKATPQDVAKAILTGLEAGQEDIFPDAFASDFGQQFHASPKASEAAIAAMVSQG